MLDVRYADDCAYVVQSPSFDRVSIVLEVYARSSLDLGDGRDLLAQAKVEMDRRSLS